MKRGVAAVVVLAGGLAFAQGAMAQGAPTPVQAPSPASLDDTQKTGQKLFYQHCGVCHTRPQINAVQFGPSLSKESAGGQDDAMRQIISDGTQRMPGFKGFFKPEQISAIVAYLKVVPVSPDAPQAAAK
jgi:mono/diheme cytochrome c family protein